jgi:hypothetical protein
VLRTERLRQRKGFTLAQPTQESAVVNLEQQMKIESEKNAANSQESPRNNKQIRTEAESIPADPQSGARTNAGKDSADPCDSRRIGKLPKAQEVRTAVVVEGAANKAREPQIIRNSIPQFDRGSYTETL